MRWFNLGRCNHYQPLMICLKSPSPQFGRYLDMDEFFVSLCIAYLNAHCVVFDLGTYVVWSYRAISWSVLRSDGEVRIITIDPHCIRLEFTLNSRNDQIGKFPQF